MADYQLTATDSVLRKADGTFIPNDPLNRDRVEYDKWLAAGGVPDPAPPPLEPMPPAPEATDVVLLDHENRLRTMEGQPAVSMDEFMRKRAK